MKNPDEQVADTIAQEFGAKELLSRESIEKLKPRLIKGTMTPEDWRLLFETESSAKTPK